MNKQIVVVNSNTYHGFSIKEAIDGIHDSGFSYIELTATKGWTEHVMPNMSLSDLLDIKLYLQEKNIKAIALSGHTNLMDKDRLKDFIDNIYLAEFFNCKYIVSSIGEAHLDDKVVSDSDVIKDNINTLIPHLEKTNLTLVLENHGFHGSGRSINKIIKDINNPLVRINYDTANVVFYSDLDPYDDFKDCINNISYIHLKDKAGGEKEWNFPALGEGYINFDKIFHCLDKSKNTSPLSIEIEFTEKGPKNLDEVNKAVNDSHDYLKKKGII